MNSLQPEFYWMQAPLHRYTFTSKKIKDWVERVIEGRWLNLFAGKTRLDVNEVRNDIRSEMNAKYHMDALKFCKTWKGRKFQTVLLDPPYSYRKSMKRYDGSVRSPFKALKDAIPRILVCHGIVITFGYHSVSMGKVRGFSTEKILLMNHGGAIHDTIAVVERRAQV